MSNEIKELEMRLQLVGDSQEKVDILNQLSRDVRDTDPTRGLGYGEEALRLAHSLSYQKGECESFCNIGLCQTLIADYDGAISNLSRALELFDAIGDEKSRAFVINRIGVVYYNRGDYKNALEHYTKGLEISRKIGDRVLEAKSLNTIGIISYELRKFDEALEQYSESLEISHQIGDQRGESKVLNNIGNIYNEQGRHEEALPYYEESLRLSQIINDKRSIIISLVNLGEVHLELRYFEKALEYYEEGLQLAREMGAKELEGYILYCIGKNYTLQGEFERGLHDLQDALRIAERIESKKLIFDIHDILSKSYETRRSFEKALYHYKEFYRLKEEIFNEEIENMQARYTIEQKEKEAEIYRLKNVELAKLNKSVSFLSEVGQKIAATLDFEKILNAIYENVNRLMDAETFGIGIYHEEDERIEYKLFIEKGERIPIFYGSVSDEDSFAAWCIKHLKEVFINDVHAEYKKYMDTFPGILQGEIPESLIYLPLIVEDRVIGMITAQSFKKNGFNQSDLEMLRTLGSYAGVALDNAAAYEKLNQTLENLKFAQVQLIQSERMASLGELSSMLGHEMNNILSGISSPTEYILNMAPLDNDKIWECWESDQEGTILQAYLEKWEKSWQGVIEGVEMIRLAEKRAREVIRALQGLVGGRSRKRGLIDLVEVFEETVLLQKKRLMNIKLTEDFEEEEMRVVITRGEVGQIFMNLIVNSVYALENVENPEIITKMRYLNGGVEIRFSDNGCGMPENIKNQIFDPFFSTKGEDGSGIGLTMVKRMIDQYHGVIKVESQVGEGTTFIIWFPKNEDEINNESNK